MSNLKGKVAIVTGSSKGIGAAIAERLAADGASVVVNYSRSEAEANALVAKIEAAGGKAVAIQADLSDPTQIKGLFDKTIEQFKQLDILVNNAGLYQFGTLDQVTPESIDTHYNLNVKGLILSTQAAARLLPEGGVIVNISSGVALTPMPAGLVYSSTKGAVDNLTRGMALDLGPRQIRVVGIAPGITTTEGTAMMDEGTLGYLKTRTPLGRIGLPADIADAVSFAVGNDGRWITGETIQVGGGLTL